MDIEKIEITNFKGIQNLVIDFSKSPTSRFYTLVGLNESGKTTILEAINNFCYGQDPIIDRDSDILGKVDYSDMIPISRRGNFNGSIRIKFFVKLSASDEQYLNCELKKMHKDVKEVKTNNPFSVSNRLVFSDSKYIPTKRLWHLHLRIKKVGSSGRGQAIDDSKDQIWQDSANILEDLFPDIIYFPSSVFDFPGRIYLDALKSPIDEFYSKILQDILSSMKKGYDVKTHILNRMEEPRSDAAKQQLKAVLLDVEKELNRSIIANWGTIFPVDGRMRKISVADGVDDSGGAGKYYLEFFIEDVDGASSINERSLGFRWFFVFRLLTYYRSFRNNAGLDKKVLFLLDEPASNLHQSAQQKLLKCFEELPDNCYLLFTTHSHHLINPKWIENLYIISNKGMDASDDGLSGDCVTNITATRYREFVNKNPSKRSYFQPVLDILDYRPSNIEHLKSAVLLEGKTDFYILKYMQFILELSEFNYDLVPAVGSGGMDTLISLYLGWGRNFTILLDSDKKIKEALSHYEKEWGKPFIDEHIIAYADIPGLSSSSAIESLFTHEERSSIVNEIDEIREPLYAKSKFNKKIQEMLMKNESIEISGETRDKFRKLFAYFDNILSE